MAEPNAYLLDTSALLAHYRGEPGVDQVQALFERSGASVFISAVTVAEFARRLKDLGASEDDARQSSEGYVSLLTEVVSVDQAVAYDAFSVAMATLGRLPLADALIVACARARGSVLVHRDKHMSVVSSTVVAQMDLAAPEVA